MKSIDRTGDDFAMLDAALVIDGHEDLSVELGMLLGVHGDRPNPRSLAVLHFLGVDPARIPYVMEILDGPYGVIA